MANMKLPDRVKQAEALALQNHGKLPTNGWLWKNEPQLYAAMKRCPDAFAHIEREPEPPKARTEPMLIAEAEKIAQDNGGELPRSGELDKISPSLRVYIQNHPEPFAHIPRAKYTPVQAERIRKGVALAEQIARDNGGYLVNDKAFQTKYGTLKTLMYNHPKPFAHIPRKVRPTTDRAGHVAHAEELARANAGLVPPQAYLKKHHGGLRSAMNRHPEDYAHLKQQKGRGSTSLTEYAEQARSMAEANGGVLQCGWWLVSNGYRNLYTAMYRHPEAFKGIQQEVIDRAGAKTIRTY